MKRIKTIISFILINLSLSVTAQEVGIQTGKNNFNSFSVGVRGIHLYDLPAYRFDTQLSRDMKGLNGENTNFDLGFDIYAEQMFTPLLGFQLSYRIANISGANEVEYYEGNFSEVALDVLTIWSNLDPSRVGSPWNIYSKIGIGRGNFESNQFLIEDDAPDDSFEDNFWEGHLGVGVSYKWNNNLRLELESNYNVAYHDGFDGFNDASGSDTYLTTALGIAYTFGDKTKAPLHHANYFEESYLFVSREDKKIEASTPQPILDTARIEALEQKNEEMQEMLKEANDRIAKLEKAEPKERVVEMQAVSKDIVLYFNSNTSSLRSETKKQLVAEFGESDNSSTELDVIGFADKYGREDYNSDLKKRRAEAVKSFLIQLGFQGNNIKVEQGKDLELKPQNQFLNRRVVVRVR